MSRALATQDFATPSLEGLLHGAGLGSPAAKCLLPLLKLLGWSGTADEVAETLPHFADAFELEDLRNVLVLLGYVSHARRVRLSAIRDEFLPCLFVADGDEEKGPLLIAGRTDGTLHALENGEEVKIPDYAPEKEGTAYYFTARTISEKAAENVANNWVLSVLSRFRTMLYHIGLCTIVSGLLAIATPIFVMVVYDRVVGQRSVESLLPLVLFMGIALAADFRLRALRGRLIARMAGRLDRLLGIAVFLKLVALPLSRTQGASVTNQINRLKSFESLRDFFTGTVPQAVLELPFVFVVIGVLAILGGWLFVLPLIAVAVLAVFGLAWLPRSDKQQTRFQALAAERQALFHETSVGLQTIRDLGIEEIWQNRLRAISARSASAYAVVQRRGAVVDAVAYGVSAATALAVLIAGANSVILGTLSVGGLIACVILTARVVSPIHALFLSAGRMGQLFRSARQVNALLRMEDELHSEQDRADVRGLEPALSMYRVSFRHPGATEPVLFGVTLTVPERGFVALIGPGGSGPSATLPLLAGIHRPQSGKVLLGGQDLQSLHPTAMRKRISYLTKDNAVFYGTVAQNLRLAAPLASDVELERVCDDAGLLDEIRALPKGWDTHLGDLETGHFSRSFVRRLALARALLSDGDILLLDEPERDLDAHGVDAITALLKRFKGEKTIVMVSYRPSFIHLADTVHVFQQGRPVMEGAPAEAMALARQIA